MRKHGRPVAGGLCSGCTRKSAGRFSRANYSLVPSPGDARPRAAADSALSGSVPGQKKAPLVSGAFSKFCRKQDESLFINLYYKHKILQALELLRAGGAGQLVGMGQMVGLGRLLIFERIDQVY